MEPLNSEELPNIEPLNISSATNLTSLTNSTALTTNTSVLALSLPKKKEERRLYFAQKVKIINNFHHLDISKFKEELIHHSFKIEDKSGNKDSWWIIKYFLNNEQIKKEFNEIFNYYKCYRYTLWATKKVDNNDKFEKTYNFKFDQISKTINFNYDEEQDTNIFKLTITQKFVINSECFNKESPFYSEMMHLYNMMLKDKLKKIGLINNDFSNRKMYYKPNDNDKLRIYNTEIYFVNGFNIAATVCDKGQILCKSVHKFRMLREGNYLQFLYKLKENYGYIKTEFNDPTSYIESTIVGKKCVAGYADGRTWRIDGIDFKNCPLETKLNSTDDTSDLSSKTKHTSKNTNKNKYDDDTTIMQYYKKQHNIDIKYPKQPLFFNKDKKTGKIAYLVPELLIVIGKMETDDNINFKELQLSPMDKYSLADEPIQKLNQINDEYIPNMPLYFKPVNLSGYILHKPAIICGKKQQMEVKSNGEFDMRGFTSYTSKKIKKWIMIYFNDDEKEAKDVYQILNQATVDLGLQFEQPTPLKLNENYKDVQYSKNWCKDEINKQLGSQQYEVALIITRKKTDWKYEFFKKLFCLEIPLPSQVITIEKMFPKNRFNNSKAMSIASKALIGMYCKINYYPYYAQPLTEDHVNIQKRTCVCSYNVSAKDPMNKNKKLTTLVSSLNQELTINGHYYKYHEDNGVFSPIIRQLFEQSLEDYEEQQNNKNQRKKKKGEDISKLSNLPEYLIIYRGGVASNLRKTVMEIELENILNLIKEKYNSKIKVCFIFVDLHNETKLFMEQEEEKSTNYEKIEMSMTSMKSLSSVGSIEKDSITNCKVGTLVEQVITGNNSGEFYINSHYTRQGTSRPTLYVRTFDNTNLEGIFLYLLTYIMCYMYFNESKSIKVPSVIQNVNRLSAFVLKHIHHEPNEYLKFNNIAM